MYANNPYAQGGWPNPQNSLSINQGPYGSFGLPPTFGALPPTDGNPNSLLRFEFCALNPDITNCTVVGPSRKKVLEVRTMQGPSHMRTTVSKENNRIFAVIDWISHPNVEISGVLPQLQTRDFLRLSADQRSRRMIILSKAYIWVPRSGGSNYLYSENLNPPEALARMYTTGTGPDTRVVLEIGTECIQPGLLEPCILATILLSSPRCID